MAGVFSALEVASSGLSAERVRMNTIASNLANARTTRTEEGGAYKRIDPVFQAQALSGAAPGAGARLTKVAVTEIREDQRPGQLIFDPAHPHANGQGYVEYPNVNIVEEMVNMISASRAYEAGVSSIEAVKQMASSAINIGK